MNVTKAKHDLMRKANTLTILNYIKNNELVTKREIEDGTGLSWGTVSIITGELKEQGIITECSSSQTSLGRTPRELDFNSKTNLMIGIDINSRGITAVIIDLKCRVLNSIFKGIIQNDRASILQQAISMTHQLIQYLDGAPHIIGIGVAMQGAVDTTRGISLFSPYFADWENIPLKEILEVEFGVPVFVEHDPNCMILAENWLGNVRQTDYMVLIRLSMGIGMSLMINQTVYKGADGTAGEFGHIAMNLNGPQCSCGNFGCLEAYSSGRSILAKAREGIKLGLSRKIELTEEDNNVNLSRVAQAARNGDVYLRGIFDSAAVYLGIGIANLIDLLNPGLVVLGGELAAYDDLLVQKAKEVASSRAWKHSRVQIMASKLGNDAAAIGAASIFVQKILLGDLEYIFVNSPSHCGPPSDR